MQSTGSFRLIVRRGPQPNQIYELNKDIITLGRDITNDIVINDPEVSRHHTRMTRGAGGYTLEDLGSTNGTFINGQRLTGARPLSSGDLVSLGETVTLAYESTLPASMGENVAPTIMSSIPSAPAPAPAPTVSQQSPYQQQQPAGGASGYSPSPAPTYQPQPQAAQPQQYGNSYSPPPPPPPQYQYADQSTMPPSSSAGLSRWFFLGCGCLIVLCVIVTVVALVYIDSNNLYCSTPLVRDVVDLVFNSCP